MHQPQGHRVRGKEPTLTWGYNRLAEFPTDFTGCVNLLEVYFEQNFAYHILSSFCRSKRCCSAEVTWNVAAHSFLALHVRIERSPLELTATTVPQRKIPASFQWKLVENSNDFMKDFGCRFCTKALWRLVIWEWHLGQHQKEQTIFQSYPIVSTDSWKAEACTVDPDDSTRCIEKHPCALPLWRCDVEQAMEPHSAPFSTGPAVCLMIAKRKVGAGTDVFESWDFEICQDTWYGAKACWQRLQWNRQHPWCFWLVYDCRWGWCWTRYLVWDGATANAKVTWDATIVIYCN